MNHTKTEELAKCLGELQRLFAELEDDKLKAEMEQHIDLVLRKMFRYFLQQSKDKLANDIQGKIPKKDRGPNLADAAVRTFNEDTTIF